MQQELTVRSHQRCEMIDLTARVAAIVADAAVDEGVCSVYVPHATAAIVIHENDDPNLCPDLLDALDRLVPAGVWRHDRVDGNGAAHIKAAMLGPGETIPIRDGRLLLGTWQAIMLVDLDGPRQRRVIVTVSAPLSALPSR
jgi:secondary thiamine-phosphate synthase enzyme